MIWLGEYGEYVSNDYTGVPSDSFYLLLPKS